MCLPSFLPCAQAGGDALYQGQEDFKREIAILRACRDPNIVSFLVGGQACGRARRRAGGGGCEFGLFFVG